MRDLRPNQDFTLDKKFVLFTWDFDEVHCFGGGSPGAKFPPTNNCNGQKRLSIFCTEIFVRDLFQLFVLIL